ncbi:hypothetical protein K2O51_31860 (plasmid) [Cupriavidus pinatubonensis]|uniref:hypothetical protein n=1 Tax=Cupriavidus pinatubonensis TaxID=248026 RepID=UPI001C72D1DA|nr:hypothetical protein [Cupriavidus pinatubonensis]QYY33623.1 hypothetical protein K2O51_31860 [Cupriavidus pinatubonensis]
MRVLEKGMGDGDYFADDIERLRNEVGATPAIDRLQSLLTDEAQVKWLRSVGGLQIRVARTQRDLERVQIAAPTEFAVGLVHGMLLFHTGEGMPMIKRMPSITREYVQLEMGPALTGPLLEVGRHAATQSATYFDQLDQEHGEYLEKISIGVQAGPRSWMLDAMETAPTQFALGVVTSWVLMRIRIHDCGGALFE